MHILVSWYSDGSGPQPKVTPCATVDETIKASIADTKMGMETTVFIVEDSTGAVVADATVRRINGPDLSE